MSLRKVRDKADSLGLLFDTICNAFGGIVVIAVLVALMTHEIKQSEDAAKAEHSQTQIVARRIAEAQTDLKEVQEALIQLRARVSAINPHIAEDILNQKDLAQELQTIRAQVQAEQSTLDNLHKAEAIADPGLKKQELAKQQSEQQEVANKLQQQIDQSNKTIQQLEQRSAELITKIKTVSTPSVKNLRLPKEHDTGKNPWYVIIKGGEIFSKNTLNSGEVQLNSRIFTVETNGDDETWTPIAGKGIPNTDMDAITQLVSNIQQSDRYISFIVYEDSFTAFIKARDNAISQGVEYGWRPEEISDSVVFSTEGTAPKPQ
jgi:predicted RNase H-like nuclease (RuvC/YqgF family)